MEKYREYLSELNDMLLRNGVDLGLEKQIEEGSIETPILVLEQYFEFNKSLAISDSGQAIKVASGTGNMLYNNILYEQLKGEYEETVKNALALLYSEAVDDNPMSEEELFQSRIDAFNEYLQENKESSAQGTSEEEITVDEEENASNLIPFDKTQRYTGLTYTVDSVIDAPSQGTDLSYDEINAQNGVGTYDDTVYTEIVEDTDDELVSDLDTLLEDEEDIQGTEEDESDDYEDDSLDYEDEEESDEDEDEDDSLDFTESDDTGTDIEDSEDDDYEDDSIDMDEEESDSDEDDDYEDDSIYSEDDDDSSEEEDEDYEDYDDSLGDDEDSLEDVDEDYEDYDNLLEDEDESSEDEDEDYEDDSLYSEDEDDSLEDEDEDYEDDFLLSEDEEEPYEDEDEDAFNFPDEEDSEDEEIDDSIFMEEEDDEIDDSLPSDEESDDEEEDFNLLDMDDESEEDFGLLDEDDDDEDFDIPDLDAEEEEPESFSSSKVVSFPPPPVSQSMDKGAQTIKKDSNDYFADAVLGTSNKLESFISKRLSRKKGTQKK